MTTLQVYELAALSAAATAVAHTGLLAALLEDAGTPAELAARAGVDAEAAELVLALLACTGLVEASAGRYGLSAQARTALITSPGGPARMIALFAHTTRFLQTGARVARMDGEAPERAAAYRDTAGQLGDFFAAQAEALADALPAARGPILDVGAGSGVWSLAMAARSPGTRVAAVDFPEVLPRLRERAARLGLADRIDELPGSFRAQSWPPRFARVVLANVVHLEDEPGAEALIARAAAALAPQGELIIVDVLDGDSSAERLGHAAYQLHLRMRTRSGRAHAREQLSTWLAAAGLGVRDTIALPGAAGRLAALVAAP